MRNQNIILAFGALACAAVSTIAGDSHAAYMNMMPMTATPRWGDNSCWADSGGSLVNNCTSSKMISYMTNIGVNTSNTPNVYVTGANNTTCQLVWMNMNQSAWGVGSVTGMPNGFTSIYMHDLTFTYGESLSIDCWVAAGAWLGTAQIFY